MSEPLVPGPVLSILDAVLAEREDKETAFDCAERILVFEAMRRSHGRQKEAADMLHMSTRILNYHCHKFRLRPKDRGRKQRELDFNV